MSELRKDPVSGRWVIIAKERADRPNPFRQYSSWVPNNESCPFCQGNEHLTPKEIAVIRTSEPGKGGAPWSVRTVANRYPALRIEGTLDMRPEGLYDKMQGIGAHEVIIETPDHRADLSQFTNQQMVNVLQMFRDRIIDLIQDLRFRYILVFKNHGGAAGATLAHAHSQVIALPIVPAQIERELMGCQRYFEYRGRCLFCDTLNQEISDGRRMVVQNGDFVAFAPFASRFAFEIQIIPREHLPYFWKMSLSQMERLAEIVRDVFRRYKLALKDPPYNFVIHSAPHGNPNADRYHWQMNIMPRLTDVAGFEWGTGFYINPMPPEEAAQHLRDLDRFMDVPEGHLMTGPPLKTHGV
ncbi:MAG: galactose-1-phosphate uridylyltransferase [Pseudomonadota bacterium]